MRSCWQIIVSLLIPSALFAPVSGARIPSLIPKYISSRSNSSEVPVPGLRALSQYVCPHNDANVRQQDSTGPPITIPRNKLWEVLLQIRTLETQIAALINTGHLNDGLGPTNSSIITITLSSTSTIALGSLSSAVEAALLDRVAGDPSTTTIYTTTIFTPMATVTAASSSNAFLTVGSMTDSSPTSTSETGAESGAILLETATSLSSTPVATGATASYVFDAQSSKNIAVYFGQTPVTGQFTLAEQCADPNIDIIILAFVISATNGGIYPTVNFGAACGGQTPEMQLEAPGLLSCPELASSIEACQSNYGKKILLSIGGATSQIAFTAPEQATAFADVLWNIFGPTGNVDLGLRPFGTVSIDGFDVDNENNMPANFDVLGSTLRTHYASDTSKEYYLSSAPQCPFPDASDPSGLLLLCDFVFVQFYNNPQCEIGSVGFTASINTWSTTLEASTMEVKPRLYVGAPAFSEAGRSAYATIGTAEGMKSVASSVSDMGLGNFGGMMFWDGPEGMLNEAGGKDIIEWAREGLVG